MNLIKSYDFFQPDTVPERLHIIGCGSVGSCLATGLARLGLTKMSLYDFDVVEEKNIANQAFFHRHIGMQKVDALREHILDINPDAAEDIVLEEKGYSDQRLSGYVFLCVDNIDLRRKIAQDNLYNPFIKAMFDFRTVLTTAQHYAADWSNREQAERLIKTMDFSPEEAESSTPRSACGGALGVAATVSQVCDVGITNFLNFVMKADTPLHTAVFIDAFKHTTDAF